jgi:hypothetical protein
MSKHQLHELQLLHKAQAQAQFALDNMNAQTAQAQLILNNIIARIAEATPKEKQQCQSHLQEQAEWITAKRAAARLTCTHCQQCAFCDPRFDKCWTGGHLPKQKWVAKLDELIQGKDVLLKLKEEGYDVTKHQKKRLRLGYLKHYCNAAPQGEPVPIADPIYISKRQCTDLPPGFYTEKTATDFFSTEEKARLMVVCHVESNSRTNHYGSSATPQEFLSTATYALVL